MDDLITTQRALNRYHSLLIEARRLPLPPLRRRTRFRLAVKHGIQRRVMDARFRVAGWIEPR